MRTNCYLVADREKKECAIIDPGDDADYLRDKINEMKLKPTAIMATHGHFDHVMAAGALQVSYNIPFMIHKKDEFLLSGMKESASYFLGIKLVDPPPIVTGNIAEEDAIIVGSHKLLVLHLPGHTPGSIAFWWKEGKALLVGDTIFTDGGVGRTDFAYSDPTAVTRSLGRILSLAGDTVLYPGHGEATTVGRERQYHRV